MLIAKGADFNAKTDYGLTALIGASWDGRRDVVQLLLTKGAEVKIKNQYDDNALSVASEMDHKDVVKYCVSMTRRKMNSRGRLAG